MLTSMLLVLASEQAVPRERTTAIAVHLLFSS
jgi:hypothetical protein